LPSPQQASSITPAHSYDHAHYKSVCFLKNYVNGFVGLFFADSFCTGCYDMRTMNENHIRVLLLQFWPCNHTFN